MFKNTIVIATCIGFTNKGAEALLKTRIAAIKKLKPQTQFLVLSIYTNSCTPIKDVSYIQTFGGQREKLRSFPYIAKSLFNAIIWTEEALRYRITGRAHKKEIKLLAKSDMFLSTDGDILGEDYGLFPYVWRLYYLNLGLLLKKPVIIYAEGIGPFKSKLGKIISKYFFNKCNYLSVREEISCQYLKDIGVEKKIDIVADSAFLLKKTIPEQYKKTKKKRIGIAVSKLATEYGFRYNNEKNTYLGFIQYMAEITDWIVHTLDAEVFLIPHVVQIKRDDYETAKDIKKYCKQKSVILISKNYNAQQLKGIISTCDLLIASRMHAIIAGISTFVPVIGIAYSHKTKGLFKRINLSTIIEIKNLDLSIKKMIIKTLKNKKEIQKQLKKETEKMQKLAKIPAIHVSKLLQ